MKLHDAITLILFKKKKEEEEAAARVETQFNPRAFPEMVLFLSKVEVSIRWLANFILNMGFKEKP